MSEQTYKLVAELGLELTPPAEGILSRTLYADDRLKIVGFGSRQVKCCPSTRPRRRP